LIGLAAFAIVLAIGAMFSTVIAVAALLLALVLAGADWLGWRPRWLRPVWFGGLLLAAAIAYWVAPRSGIGGEVSTCEDLPAIGAAAGDSSPSKPAPPNTQAHESSSSTRVPEQAGLITETTRFVSVERDHVRYEERTDLTLKRGYFDHLDLSALAVLLQRSKAQTQVIVGGDGLLAQPFRPDELRGTIGLSTKPRSVWVETLVQVPPGIAPTCRGVTLLPFQKVRLEWPQPFATPIGGRVKLADDDEPVPFTEIIGKEASHAITVVLPHRSLFRQRPVQLQPKSASASTSGDRFVLAKHLDAGDLALTVELLPDWGFIRSEWAYARRDVFFPLNWSLALVYVLIASVIGDTFLRRRPPFLGFLANRE
jgi:hypothetical protein